MKRFSLCLTTTLLSLNLFAHTSRPVIIYGEDNRKDTYEVTNPLFLKLAQSTAAQIPNRNITIRGSTAELNGPTLKEFTPNGLPHPICDKERFSHQITAGNCSGFLVAPNVIATAGHCMTSINDCRNFKWVFNYKVQGKNDSAVSVAATDVYSCTKILKQSLNGTLDFALIQIDRAVVGKAVKIAAVEAAVGDPLVVIGFPTGLPQKVSDQARVISKQGLSFMTDLDTFAGNSGSAVFNARSGELVGILVNGRQDYRRNVALGCSEVNVMANSQGGEGVSSIKQFSAFLK